MTSADLSFAERAPACGRLIAGAARLEASCAQPVDGALVMKCVFDASPELVFGAWRESSHVAEWFGPCEAGMTMRELDVRPGGAFRIEGLCNAGRHVRIEGRYREVVEPDWIVFADACFIDDELICETLVTVTFHELEGQRGSRTRLTIHCEPVKGFGESAQRRWGAGWSLSLERLANYLARISTPSCDFA